TGGERRRPEIVVTLLAVLELVRLGRIRTQQTELFGDIVIERREDAPTAIEISPDSALATVADDGHNSDRADDDHQEGLRWEPRGEPRRRAWLCEASRERRAER